MSNYVGVNEFSSLYRKGFCVFVITFIVLAALSIKKPDAIFHPQLWAEDGVIFLAQQREYGIFHALLTPYAGYYHLVPRVTAAIADSFPLIYTPMIYNCIAVLLTCCVSYYIFFSRIELSNIYAKFMLSLVPVLVPHTGEVLITVTNIQWVLALCLPFLYIQDIHQHWLETLVSLFVVIIIGLTGPFMIFSSATLVLRFLYYRKFNRYEFVFYVSILIISLVQAICIIYNYDFRGPTSQTTHEWPYQIKEIFKQFFIYFYFGGIFPLHFSKTLLPFSILITVITFSILLTTNLLYRYYIVTSLLVAVIIFSAVIVKMHDPWMIIPYGAGARYYYIPYGCIFIAHIFLCWSSRQWQRYFGVFILTLVLFSSATVFVQWPPFTDFQWRDHVKELSQKETVVVPINPPGWRVELTRKPHE